MFPTSLLINRISDVTGYTVKEALAVDNEQLDPKILPFVYVGYNGITRVPPVPINMDFLEAHGEDLIQVFEVKLIAKPEEFVDNWQQIYMSLINYTPTISTGSTASSTNLAFINSVTNLRNGKVHDIAKWGIGFPTTNVFL